MRPLEPVHTAHLFPALHAALIELLRGLEAADWNRPTLARRWSVRDIARARLIITGDVTLAEPIFGARAVMV